MYDFPLSLSLSLSLSLLKGVTLLSKRERIDEEEDQSPRDDDGKEEEEEDKEEEEEEEEERPPPPCFLISFLSFLPHRKKERVSFVQYLGYHQRAYTFLSVLDVFSF